MKASVKFREDQFPLFKVKVPLSILGYPFQSGITVGEAKDLTLHLSTWFETGPSFRIAYRPNDTGNPFSLIFKTGSGPFGSPISSSMYMSAEFNLLNRNTGFMLHFKPQFGDFSIKKSESSFFDKTLLKLQNCAVGREDDPSIRVVQSPISNMASPWLAAVGLQDILSGLELTTRTKVPIGSQAVVNCSWGVRVPAATKSGTGVCQSTAGINFRNFLPYLVMNKIKIEHVYGADLRKNLISKVGGAESCLKGKADVAEIILKVWRDENGSLKRASSSLKRAFEILRQQKFPGKSNSSTGDSNSAKIRGTESSGIVIGMDKASNGRDNGRSTEKKSAEGEWAM